MSWNYRIMKHGEKDGVWYGVHEVFYDDDGNLSWTMKPVVASADSPEGVIEDVELMLADIKKYKDDILDYDDDTP